MVIRVLSNAIQVCMADCGLDYTRFTASNGAVQLYLQHDNTKVSASTNVLPQTTEGLHSSGMLRSDSWWSITDVSGHRVGPIIGLRCLGTP